MTHTVGGPFWKLSSNNASENAAHKVNMLNSAPFTINIRGIAMPRAGVEIN